VEAYLPHTTEDDKHHNASMLRLYQAKLQFGPMKPLMTIGDVSVVMRNWPLSFRDFAFFMSGDQPIGFAILQRGGRDSDGTGDFYSVTLIWLLPEFRKQGIAVQFYRHLIQKGVHLKPDTKQSEHGANIWNRLDKPQ
jgi:GNAT superfamily N-acetyltransferase